MAEWQYRIEHVQLETGSDSELENILSKNGQEGWELVQVLPEQVTPDWVKCRLIFKTEKPLD